MGSQINLGNRMENYGEIRVCQHLFIKPLHQHMYIFRRRNIFQTSILIIIIRLRIHVVIDLIDIQIIVIITLVVVIAVFFFIGLTNATF